MQREYLRSTSHGAASNSTENVARLDELNKNRRTESQTDTQIEKENVRQSKTKPVAVSAHARSPHNKFTLHFLTLFYS
jgi:hypothetical protein